jgi:biotin carboxyl carrier protein
MRQFRVLVNGNEYRVAIEELEEDSGEATAIAAPRQKRAQTVAAVSTTAPKTGAVGPGSGAGAAGSVVAALPGTILAINVTVGDAVARGQSLLILEAMKMENDIMAPCDGVVKEVFAVKGASVNSGDLLIVLS